MALQNCTHKIVGTKLVIEVDLTQTVGPSSTGKNLIVGSTGGNCVVDGWKQRKISFGLNVFTPKTQG